MLFILVKCLLCSSNLLHKKTSVVAHRVFSSERHGHRWLCKEKRLSSMNRYCRRFALVSAGDQTKMNDQRIHHRTFASSKQATLGRAKNSIEKYYLVFTHNHWKKGELFSSK